MTQIQTFTEAVTAYLSHADYLTEADAPLTVALQRVAEELDTNGVTAPLVNVFTVTMRGLQKKAGSKTEETDPAEDFLDSL